MNQDSMVPKSAGLDSTVTERSGQDNVDSKCINQSQLDRMLKLIILRGLVAPSCHYWAESDKQLRDKSGIYLYRKLVKQAGTNRPFIPLQMLGVDLQLVVGLDQMEYIFQHSPHLFAVGQLKLGFFSNFMGKNVGVSTGKEWLQRRLVNVETLHTDRAGHVFGEEFDRYIREAVGTSEPHCFQDFLRVAERLATRICFGRHEAAKPIFRFLAEANSIDQYSEGGFQPDPELLRDYVQYMLHEIRHPREKCLMQLATQFESDEEELLHQIPHWVFPIGAAIHTLVPRLLTLLANHPSVWKRVLDEIRDRHYVGAWRSVLNLSYLRQCILETLRINNNVVSLFRTAVKGVDFGNGYVFPKGTQFAVLTNPVLRNPDYFEQPESFYPERWTPDLEERHIASISFSRGPQRCPGKDLVLFIVMSYTAHFLRRVGVVCNRDCRFRVKQLDTKKISHAINPCRLKFDYE